MFNSGMFVTGGLSVNGNMYVTGGLTVSQGLMNLGGLTVKSSGMLITGGVTVNSAGVVVTGGLTVKDTGFVCSGGLSVNAGGMVVTGGLTVRSGPVNIYGGISVHNDGFVMAGTDGITIMEGGLVVNDYITIQNGGLTVGPNGATVSSGGMKVTGGVTVLSGGLFVTGGMTVYGNAYIQAIFPLAVPSDRRLKTDIQTLEEPLSKLSKLHGVYFSWIQNEPSGLTFDKKRHVGLIAQEVQAVLPEVVHEYSESKYLGVNYVEMVPLLLEAIRELDQRTECLSLPSLHSNSSTIDRTNVNDNAESSNGISNSDVSSTSSSSSSSGRVDSGHTMNEIESNLRPGRPAVSETNKEKNSKESPPQPQTRTQSQQQRVCGDLSNFVEKLTQRVLRVEEMNLNLKRRLSSTSAKAAAAT